jgi:hypothetical protein
MRYVFIDSGGGDTPHIPAEPFVVLCVILRQALDWRDIPMASTTHADSLGAAA